MNRRLFCAALLLLLLHAPALLAQAPARGKTVRLLTVGNSFSQNAVHYLPELAKADGNVLVLRGAVKGGASLEQHWQKAQWHEKDPADKRGRYDSSRSLKEELLAEKWDYVTIQQASIKSHDVATYRPFAGHLRDYVKQHAPQAELLLHETWAYRVDDPRFAARKTKPGEPATREAMFQGLAAAYAAIAKELGVRRIPVGHAFHMAETDSAWGFKPDTKFDFKNARPPALPDQTHSLHVGWRWVKPKDKPGAPASLLRDGHHANTAGEYLGACVFYEVLFDANVVENKFVPPKLTAEDARYLRETAHRAVAEAR